MVDAAAVDPAQLQMASQGEPAAEHQLFVQLTESASREGADVSATVHGTTALPVAWTGRPVEVPDLRLTGPEAVFLVPDAQGLRLVRVHPLNNPADPAQRAGTLVVQAPLARSDPGGQSGDYVLPTSLVSVTVRPRFQGGTDAAPDEFLIRASNGDVLASVSASPTALARARDSLRGRVQATLLALVAVILLLATGPLLDWRRVSRRNAVGVLASVLVAVLLIAAWMLFRAGISASGLLIGSPPRQQRRAGLAAAGVVLRVAAAFPGVQPAGGGADRAPGVQPRRVAPGAAPRRPPAGADGAGLHGVSRGAGRGRRGGRGAGRGLRSLPPPRCRRRAGRHPALRAAAVGLAPAGDRHRRHRPQRLGRHRGGRRLSPGAGPVCGAIADADGPRPHWSRLARGAGGGDGSAASPAAGRPRCRPCWWSSPSRRSRGASATSARACATRRRRPGCWRWCWGWCCRRWCSIRRWWTPPSAPAAPLVETRYAPEVLDQRRTVQARLAETLANIDRIAGLDDLVAGRRSVVQGAPPTDAAFLVWSQTSWRACA